MTETLDEVKARLLNALPADGSPRGNGALRKQLRVPQNVFWSARNELISDAAVERGRGRGGSTRLLVVRTAEPNPADVPQLAELEADRYTREAHLYPPLRDVLRSEWAQERGVSPVAVEITALQGRRPTGGRWTRPDLVVVDVRAFSMLPGKYLDLHTFEVKLADAADVSAVYEALAHRRSATHAYVLIHDPDGSLGSDDDGDNDVAANICRAARQHGVGIIIASDPAAYDTWDERERATRVEPDLELLDEFLRVQMPREARDRIQLAVR